MDHLFDTVTFLCLEFKPGIRDTAFHCGETPLVETVYYQALPKVRRHYTMFTAVHIPCVQYDSAE